MVVITPGVAHESEDKAANQRSLHIGNIVTLNQYSFRQLGNTTQCKVNHYLMTEKPSLP